MARSGCGWEEVVEGVVVCRREEEAEAKTTEGFDC